VLTVGVQHKTEFCTKTNIHSVKRNLRKKFSDQGQTQTSFRTRGTKRITLKQCRVCNYDWYIRLNQWKAFSYRPAVEFGLRMAPAAARRRSMLKPSPPDREMIVWNTQAWSDDTPRSSVMLTFAPWLRRRSADEYLHEPTAYKQSMNEIFHVYSKTDV